MPSVLPEVWTFPCPRCGEPVEGWDIEPAYMMRTEFGPYGGPGHSLIVGDQKPPGGFGRWTMESRVESHDRNTMRPCGDVILGPWSPPQPPVEWRLEVSAEDARRARKASERAEGDLRAVAREAATAGLSAEDIARAAGVSRPTVDKWLEAK